MNATSCYARPPWRPNLLPRMGFALVALAMVIAILAAVSAVAAAPQQSRSADIHYAPDAQEVTVKTPFGEPQIGSVAGAHPGNFVVYEDGRRLKDVSVAIEHAPLSVGVLFEYGGRYRALNEILAQQVSNATSSLLDETTPDDKVPVWKYADGVEAVASEGGVTGGLGRTLGSLPPPPFSEVNFRDALIGTLHKMQPIPGHKALILLSTGIDTFSKASFTDALAETRRAGVPLYVLNLGSLVRTDLPPSVAAQPLYSRLKWDEAECELAALARASGGRMYSPQIQLDLAPVFDELIANLRTRYVFRYKTSDSANGGGPRTVRVVFADPAKASGGLSAAKPHTTGGRERLVAEGAYNPRDATVAPAKAPVETPDGPEPPHRRSDASD